MIIIYGLKVHCTKDNKQNNPFSDKKQRASVFCRRTKKPIFAESCRNLSYENIRIESIASGATTFRSQ